MRSDSYRLPIRKVVGIYIPNMIEKVRFLKPTNSFTRCHYNHILYTLTQMTTYLKHKNRWKTTKKEFYKKLKLKKKKKNEILKIKRNYYITAFNKQAS